jgi:hypothetical protein
MRHLEKARPLAVAATGRACIGGRAMGSPGIHSSTAEPVVLSVPKRGKACLVAKVVPLDGEPVLGVVNRAQRGGSLTMRGMRAQAQAGSALRWHRDEQIFLPSRTREGRRLFGSRIGLDCSAGSPMPHSRCRACSNGTLCYLVPPPRQGPR